MNQMSLKFMNKSLFKLKKVFFSVNVGLSDVPFHVSFQNRRNEELIKTFNSKKEKYQSKNSLYKDFLHVNKTLKNSDNLIKFFDVDALDLKNAQNSLLKLGYSKIEREEIKKIGEKINSLLLTPQNPDFIDNLKTELSSYVSNLEKERTINTENYLINNYLEDISQVVNFLFSVHSFYFTEEIAFIQELTLKYFEALNTFGQIPLDIVKNNFEIIFRIIENYYMKRDRFQNLVDFEGKFNSTLGGTIDKMIMTLTKYSGDNSSDLAATYFLISYYNLVGKNFSKAEDYAVKCHSIIKKKMEGENNVNNASLLSPVFLIGELYFTHYKNFTEAFAIFSEAFNILSSSKQNNMGDSHIFEFVKMKICQRMGKLARLTQNQPQVYYEYALNHINKIIVSNNYSFLNPYLDILGNLSNLYQESDHKRKNYEVIKATYSVLSEKSLGSQRELNLLISLFKYSDDYNTRLGYLKQENVSKEYFLNFANYILQLLRHSVLVKKDFIVANTFLDIISESILTNTKNPLNENFLIEFHSLAALVKRNQLEIDSALNHITQVTSIIHNSQTYNADLKSKQLNLIKLHFNSAYLSMLDKQNSKVIENLETCVKLIRETLTDNLTKLVITNEEKAKLYEFSSTLQILLANLHKEANDSIKSELCLSGVNELLSKSDLEDILIFNLDKRRAVLDYIQDFKSSKENKKI